MYQQVHLRKTSRILDEFNSADPAGRQVLRVFRRQLVAVVILNVLMRGEQESGCTASWINDSVPRGRPHAVNHGVDQGTWGEVLTRSGFGVFGALLQKRFVGITLDIDFSARPVFFVDQVNDQLLKRCCVADLFCALWKIRPNAPLLLPSCSRTSS